ncbi:MAG: cell division protein FtsA [Anaerolineae bacterium]|nr:cell division protein FtsA [Anaerolineae bacterium]
MERVVACIDVGTSKICTLIGEVDEFGDLRIVGVGIVPSRGIRKGVVVNVQEATAAILASVERAERLAGYAIESAYVGLAGAHIASINSRGAVAINRGERGVQPADIERALDAARAIPIPYNRQVLHVIPRSYILDGDDGVRDPLGMQAYRLEVEAHIVTGATTSIQNLVKCVQAAGLGIEALILEPLASGEAVLTDAEREMGVALVDIGGGTTDIAVFIEGSIWHTVVLPVGGEQITHDIAVGLCTPFATAEELKIKHGNACPRNVQLEDWLEVTAFGEGNLQKVSRHFLAQIIEARVEEIFELVHQEIKRSGYDGLLPAGVVLCGGSADLAGIRDVAREVLGLPVRIGTPYNLQGLVDALGRPAYATSVGLLQWGLHRDPRQSARPRRGEGLKILNWLKALLPDRSV